MPMINYSCSNEECKATKKSLYRKHTDIEKSIVCDSCGGSMMRVLSAPNSVSKMTIDNGQARAVETYTNIMELREDRIKPTNRGD